MRGDPNKKIRFLYLLTLFNEQYILYTVLSHVQLNTLVFRWIFWGMPIDDALASFQHFSTFASCLPFKYIYRSGILCFPHILCICHHVSFPHFCSFTFTTPLVHLSYFFLNPHFQSTLTKMQFFFSSTVHNVQHCPHLLLFFLFNYLCFLHLNVSFPVSSQVFPQFIPLDLTLMALHCSVALIFFLL